MALANNAVRSTPRVAPGSVIVANDDPKSTFPRKQPGESTNAANSITFNVPMTSRTVTLNKMLPFSYIRGLIVLNQLQSVASRPTRILWCDTLC